MPDCSVTLAQSPSTLALPTADRAGAIAERRNAQAHADARAGLRAVELAGVLQAFDRQRAPARSARCGCAKRGGVAVARCAGRWCPRPGPVGAGKAASAPAFGVPRVVIQSFDADSET
jgi:hypothetical protein